MQTSSTRSSYSKHSLVCRRSLLIADLPLVHQIGEREQDGTRPRGVRSLAERVSLYVLHLNTMANETDASVSGGVACQTRVVFLAVVVTTRGTLAR